MKAPGQVRSLASVSMTSGPTSLLPSRLRQEPVLTTLLGLTGPLALMCRMTLEITWLILSRPETMALDTLNRTLRCSWMLPQPILSTIYPTLLELETTSLSRSIPLALQLFRAILVLPLDSQDHPLQRPLIPPQNLSTHPPCHPLTHPS